MVSGRDNHDIDVFVFHDLAEVLCRLGIRVGLFCPVEGDSFRIAEVSDLDARHGGHSFCVATALAAEPDAGDTDRIVCTEDPRGG